MGIQLVIAETEKNSFYSLIEKKKRKDFCFQRHLHKQEFQHTQELKKKKKQELRYFKTFLYTGCF